MSLVARRLSSCGQKGNGEQVGITVHAAGGNEPSPHRLAARVARPRAGRTSKPAERVLWQDAKHGRKAARASMASCTEGHQLGCEVLCERQQGGRRGQGHRTTWLCVSGGGPWRPWVTGAQSTTTKLPTAGGGDVKLPAVVSGGGVKLPAVAGSGGVKLPIRG